MVYEFIWNCGIALENVKKHKTYFIKCLPDFHVNIFIGTHSITITTIDDRNARRKRVKIKHESKIQ